MEIITGFTGAKHVRSEQDRDINIGTFGEESYVLQTGMKMAAEVSSNNEIKIRDGVIMHQGCAASIKKNTYDSVTIVNGSQGMKRIDLIVARYQRNQDDGKEFMRFVAIQGTPAESNPAVPSHITGDIQSGDAVADMPMYKIIIDGLNITDVQKVFSEAPNITELNRKLPVCNEIYSGVANHAQYDIPDITPYDLLVIYGGPGTYANTSMVVPVASIVHKDDGQFAFGVYQSSTTFWELEFNFPSNVKINIANYKNQSWTTPAIRKIVGVKL